MVSLRDFRYAARVLVKQPGFTSVAILTLALGIGANSAIFSVVNALLLRPLPYPHSDWLVLLRERSTAFDSGSVSYPNYLDWQAGQRTFTDIALVRRESVNLSSATDDAEPVRVETGRVTANFFSILEVKPLAGRDFAQADDLAGSRSVAMISETLWKRRFGRSKNVLGRQVTIDGVPREIVGVVPSFVRMPRGADVFIPLGELRANKAVLERGNHPGFSALARLKPGVTLAQATADLNNIAEQLERLYPEDNTGRRINPRILLESAVADYRQGVILLLAAVGCVLLIACANVANLQLARALARGREMAVRAALGASRIQLARQLFIESGLIAIVGAAAGVLLAVWSLDLIKALAPTDVTRFQETQIDLTVLGFTGAIALAAGVLVALWPALRISHKASLTLDLHQGGRSSDGAQRQRMRSGLVVAQVALALILLAAAGLTLKSFWRAQNTPLGFDPRDIVTMTIALPKARYDSDEKIAAFNSRLLERVRVLPGVEAAAIGVNIPFDDSEWDSNIHITGTPEAPKGSEPSAEVNVISPDYFKVMRMPLLRGRGFTDNDRLGQPGVIIIDQSLAERFFPGKDPIGARMDNHWAEAKDAPPLTIIGVVPRTRNEAPGENNIEKLNFPQIYLAQLQFPERGNSLVVRVRSGDPLSLVGPIKKEMHELDPDQAVSSIATMETNVSKSLGTRRMIMSLLASFAGLALVLASVGLYGVMALSVTQRTRELGIRLALGADRGDVFRLVLGQGVFLVSIGLVFGLIGALFAGRALISVLYGVGAVDFVALSVAITALAFVAIVACFLPARRATQVDPVIALRSE